jgi:hypothetical protein
MGLVNKMKYVNRCGAFIRASMINVKQSFPVLPLLLKKFNAACSVELRYNEPCVYSGYRSTQISPQ